MYACTPQACLVPLKLESAVRFPGACGELNRDLWKSSKYLQVAPAWAATLVPVSL